MNQNISIQKLMLFLGLFFSLTVSSSAQKGYIYIHNKTMDESSAVDFPFSFGSNSFSLNDKPDNLFTRDLGADAGGRLWAVASNVNNMIYYRNMGASNWVATGIQAKGNDNSARIDGNAAGYCVFIDNSNQVVSSNGTASTVIGTMAGNFGNSNPVDVAGDGNGNVYVVTANGWLYRYAGSSWSRVGSSTDNKFVDADPTTGDAIVVKTGNTISRITSGGTTTNLGKTSTDEAIWDVAVDAAGKIFKLAKPFGNNNGFVSQYSSGTIWADYEVTSRRMLRITAGLGGQVWGIFDGNFALPIFSRSFDGTNTSWVDDERVRNSPSGNSVMLAVDPGTYTITNPTVSNWSLTKIEVFDPTNNSSYNFTARNASLTVAAGETVHVVFTNWLQQSTNMTQSCQRVYLENFGNAPSAGQVSTTPLAGQTAYHFHTGGIQVQDGYYQVTPNSGTSGIINVAAMNDHTSGNNLGRMMLVNAAYDKNEFFRRSFTNVTANAQYNFYAWIASVNNHAIQPNVTFNVYKGGTQEIIATTSSQDIPYTGQWQQYGLQFTPGVTTIDLVIVNNAIGGTGNDLALDDISFAMAPPDVPVPVVTHPACGSSTGSIVITSPLGSSYQYSIDGTNWQTSPTFNNLAPNQYVVRVRFASTTDCVNSVVDTVKQTICGRAFNDPNGMTDNTINGTGVGSLSSTQLYAFLYDNTAGKVVDSIPVNADGTYSLHGTPSNNASIYLTTTPAKIGQTTVPVVTLPTGWAATGEGTTAAGDGTPDGIINLGALNAPVNGANFGMVQTPESYNVSKNVTGAPALNKPIDLSDMPLQGSDPNSQPAQGSWTGKSLLITSMPTNGFVLTYNGHQITAAEIGTNGYRIDNYDPTKLSITPVSASGGTNQTTFTYAVINAAGVKDTTPATATINFTIALPVVFGSIQATFNADGLLEITWEALSEKNNSHYEIEVSKDGNDFTNIGTVLSKATDGNSDNTIRYEFSKALDRSLFLGGGMIALLAAGFGFKRRKKASILILAAGLVSLTIGCGKKASDMLNTRKETVFVRILQVDKDGTKAYSKVVKAINTED